jgi:predicted DNA-binding protein with PD1-like motif
MRTLAVRLHPGDDLKRAVKRLVAEHAIQAGWVLTCVGSLSRAVLRPAGPAEPVTIEGPLEIMSLVGTLSPDGVHLHLSVADRRCATAGGHLLDGCLVRTTAELVLGVGEDVVFGRQTDPGTGYDELVVRGGGA